MQITTRIKRFTEWLKDEHIHKKGTREIYDQISKGSSYDGIINLENRIKDLEKFVKNINFTNKIVLDLACGSGAFINAILPNNPKWVVGVDLSNGMLKLAKQRFKNNKKISFKNISFMDVNFKKDTFDAIVMANASRYIPEGEEDRFFKNITEWLKKDGVFVIHSDFWNGFIGKLALPFAMFFRNKSNTNPNTTFEWNLERELTKHFIIKKRVVVGRGFWGAGQNLGFICKKLN